MLNYWEARQVIQVQLHGSLTSQKISIKIRFQLNKNKSLEWNEHFDANGKRKTSCNSERSNEPEQRMTDYENPVLTYRIHSSYLFLGSVQTHQKANCNCLFKYWRTAIAFFLLSFLFHSQVISLLCLLMIREEHANLEFPVTTGLFIARMNWHLF